MMAGGGIPVNLRWWEDTSSEEGNLVTSQALSILPLNSLFHLQFFMSVLFIWPTYQPCGRKTPWLS